MGSQLREWLVKNDDGESCSLQRIGTVSHTSFPSSCSCAATDTLPIAHPRSASPFIHEVPKTMPACPDEGCTCVWFCIPYHRSQSNMCMEGYKSKIANATSSMAVPSAKPPVFCKYDQGKCLTGAKQVIVTHRLMGDNINVTSVGPNRPWDMPIYSEDCGFKSGPQDDIFEAV